MPLPKTLVQIARAFGVDVAAVRAELRKLGVPILDFLGKECVYEADICAAHHREGRGVKTDRAYHVQRVRDELRRMGCTIEPMKLEEARQIDCFLVGHREGGEKKVGIKIQVVSSIQRGGVIHFNIGTALLRDNRIGWYVLVAPPFAPDIDYLAPRGDLFRRAKKMGYLNGSKPSFPQRITQRTGSYPFIKIGLQALLPDLGVGALAVQRAAAAQDAAESDE